MGESLQGRSATTTEVAEGIASSQAIIDGFQAALAVISDDKAKRDLELKVEREEVKLKALQNRQANYNAISVLENQVDHTQLEVQIPVLTDAIASVEAHKATLLPTDGPRLEMPDPSYRHQPKARPFGRVLSIA